MSPVSLDDALHRFVWHYGWSAVSPVADHICEPPRDMPGGTEFVCGACNRKWTRDPNCPQPKIRPKW